MDDPSAYAQGYLRKLLTSDITRTLRLVGGKVFFLLAYLLFKRGFSFAYAQCLKMDQNNVQLAVFLIGQTGLAWFGKCSYKKMLNAKQT